MANIAAATVVGLLMRRPRNRELRAYPVSRFMEARIGLRPGPSPAGYHAAMFRNRERFVRIVAFVVVGAMVLTLLAGIVSATQ